MGGVKRPARSLPPETISKIIEMGRAGRPLSEIADAVGLARGTVYARLAMARRDGLVGPPPPRGGRPRELGDPTELSDKLDRECRGWLKLSREARRAIQRRVDGGDELDIKDAGKALLMAEKAKKLSELLRGRVTSRSESVRAPDPAKPSSDEEAEMARLAALAQETERGRLQ